MREVIISPDGSWQSREQIEALQRFEKNRMKSMLFRDEDIAARRREDNYDNRKLAYIRIGNHRIVAWIDPDNMSIAYKNTHPPGYAPTDMQWREFIFERWMTSFDV